MKKTMSQVEWTLTQLKKGEVLSMLTMLTDYGIGNHTSVITRARRALEQEGNGEEIVTEWRFAKSRITKQKIKYAIYYIPTRRKETIFTRLFRNR